ncbi:hypothetical protein, partial [Nocardioides sp. YIM 152588]|uniref:hypothetical protein n=1 Tax=Nocardioides sp. YIM 152588 TaxID=3158259 RepID=UPI0032E4A8E1
MPYADPRRCPDCRSELTGAVERCPTCGLALRHPLASELFGALTSADALLAELRRASAAPTATPSDSARAISRSGVPLSSSPSKTARRSSVATRS